MNKWDYKKLTEKEKNNFLKQIKDLYYNNLMTDAEIGEKLNCKTSFIAHLRRENNIKRDKESIKKRREITSLERFGATNVMHSKIGKDKFNEKLENRTKEDQKRINKKRKQTNRERYGVDCNWQSEKTKAKIRETNKERYGNEYYVLTDEFKEKATTTLQENYGVDNPLKSEVIKNRAKETLIERFGVDNCSKSKIIKKKKEETKLKHFGDPKFVNLEKRKQTNRERYGCECVFANENIKRQIRCTMTKHFGVDHNNRRHLSQRTLEATSCKENLKQFIIDNNIKTYYDLYNELSDLSLSHIYKIPKKYHLEDMLVTDYTKYENELREFLKTHDIKFVVNTRSIIKPLELDIYIQEHNVAIEFNGTYWHSALQKDANYHYNKSKMCEDKNIRLIHIWEHEWTNERQRPILENIILSACGKIQNRIYARNCKIEIKKPIELKEFFEQNNIQGFRSGKFAICLTYNNEVVMSYIFGYAHFGKGKYEIEVIRGATKLNTTIVGGASKIWKYFKENYNYDNCVYYVDYNYFNGSSISHLDENFKFVKTQPSFKNWWVKEGIIKNRQPSKHKEIKELEKQGLVISIYNAGTKVYVWER